MDGEIHNLLMKKAGTLLARRPYSRGELKKRLAKIAGAFSVEAVLERLEQLNLLNDADYAYNFALCRMKQEGWGPAKVQSSLFRRHIDPTTVEWALQRVRNELGYESLLAGCVQAYCGKKGLPGDLKSLRKLVLHLSQRGFDQESIVNVLGKMIPASLWQQFDTGE